MVGFFDILDHLPVEFFRLEFLSKLLDSVDTSISDSSGSVAKVSIEDGGELGLVSGIIEQNSQVDDELEDGLAESPGSIIGEVTDLGIKLTIEKVLANNSGNLAVGEDDLLFYVTSFLLEELGHSDNDFFLGLLLADELSEVTKSGGDAHLEGGGALCVVIADLVE